MTIDGVAGDYPVHAYLLEGGPMFKHGNAFYGTLDEFLVYASRQWGAAKILRAFADMVDTMCNRSLRKMAA
jgi:hypothetical protein